jgi:hypothetical protein
MSETKADAVQVGGSHYKALAVEPWAAMAAWMTPPQFQGFLLGSAIAYLARVNTEGVTGKGGVQDVKKAAHYCQKLAEVMEAQSAADSKHR